MSKDNTCDLCGGDFIRVDGGKGDGNSDSLMVNDYITMTEWYKTKKPDWFKVGGPNPFACRRCVRVLRDAGLRGFIGSGSFSIERFLTVQNWWEKD